MLVERSQTQNIKLREIVRSMLVSVRKMLDPHRIAG
jgi:hypothetical protein